MDRNNEKLYLCDPNKNIECKKTDCGHLGTGKCFCTTKKEFMADGYIVDRPKTNQDKLAEMVRTMDVHKLALFITNGIECPNCPAEKYCDQHTYTSEDGWSRVPDENGEILDCNQIFERWLRKKKQRRTLTMGYKVVDFNNETVRVGFSTEGAAWNWLYSVFSKDYIKDAGFKVVKEDDDD